jgi:hypothetical protein
MMWIWASAVVAYTVAISLSKASRATRTASTAL